MTYVKEKIHNKDVVSVSSHTFQSQNHFMDMDNIWFRGLHCEFSYLIQFTQAS
jgi:hypothetical protein